MPGSRWVSGRIALKTCVTARTPRSKAALASAAVALLCPSETAIPRACRRSTSSSAPGSSGAERDEPHRPGFEQALEQRRVGIVAPVARVGAEPVGRDERPLEVRSEDARAGGIGR